MTSSPFAVSSPLVRLAVVVRDGAVHEIELHGTATRPPTGPIERAIAAELTEYLDGRRRQFTFGVAPVGSPFYQSVWRVLQTIPYGETRSYGDVARRLGRPRSSRAVGRANHENPIPIVIPCHRVVAADGGLGGFGGGKDLKRRLLQLEGALSPTLI